MASQPKRSHPRVRLFAVLLIALATLAAGAWNGLLRTLPVEHEDAVEAFKYGTIGVERSSGIPYWIWLVLPRVFPEHLPGPGGYASLGMTWEEGEELPVGFSKTTIGFPRVGPNCAFCHTSTFRVAPGEPRQVVAGGASSTVDTQGYLRFLIAAASDPRFTAEKLMPEIEYLVRLNAAERAFYAAVLIPQTRQGILALKEQYAFMETQPDWGPGRIDPFNPVKQGILRRPRDGTIGNSDMMPIWSLHEREGKPLHWDGLNSSIREVVLSSALGDGTSREALDVAALRELENWLRRLDPPRYPFPVDLALAATGEPLFNANCASCHGVPGNWIARAIPISEVGTDPERARMWDAASAEAYNRYAAGYEWRFGGFRDQQAYVAPPLGAVWLRAPYLHNGSVPTLWHLLRPAQRPARFHRGYDVLDPVRVGFLWEVPQEGSRKFFSYDTTLPGNSNAGHLYGSQLGEEEKVALVEYLKTL